jgi:hypothetical protein
VQWFKNGNDLYGNPEYEKSCQELMFSENFFHMCPYDTRLYKIFLKSLPLAKERNACFGVKWPGFCRI